MSSTELEFRGPSEAPTSDVIRRIHRRGCPHDIHSAWVWLFTSLSTGANLQSLPLCKNFQGATRFSIVRAVHASDAQVDTYRLRSAYVAGKSTDRGDYASAILDF